MRGGGAVDEEEEEEVVVGTHGRPTDRRYEHVTGEDETRMSSPEAGSAQRRRSHQVALESAVCKGKGFSFFFLAG